MAEGMEEWYNEEYVDILESKIKMLENKIQLLETTIELLKEAQQDGIQHG